MQCVHNSYFSCPTIQALAQRAAAAKKAAPAKKKDDDDW